MSDLFEKLNVLVKSNLRNILGQNPRRETMPTPPRLGSDLDREIAAVRGRINQALADEDQLESAIAALHKEAAEWDQKADEAVARGDDASARYAIQQMQNKRQQASLLEADLAQHRDSVAELIRQVNEMEAVVAEARRHQAQTGDMDDSEPDAGTDHALSARLKRAREFVTGIKPIQAASDSTAQSPALDEQSVEDSLAERRKRLSQ